MGGVRQCRSLVSRRANDWDPVPAISPIDAEIRFIHRQHGCLGVHFAHANQAQVGQIGVTVGIAVGQRSHFLDVPWEVKSNSQEATLKQRHYFMG